MSSRDFLTRRNALWAHLRNSPPGSPEFEATLTELSVLIGWDRERVLGGLGLRSGDVPLTGRPTP